MNLLHLSKSYHVSGEYLSVLDDFTLSIEPGTITAFVGPSGCGKTTLLRLIGELERPDGGEVVKSVEERGPLSYLFQEPRLLPWHTVLHNVELVMRPWYPVKEERIARAKDFLSMVGLSEFTTFKPDQLSGGMRQRVAIARAFAYPGHMLLLDEPFQSLDTNLRWALVHAFLKVWNAEKRTTVYVTHDVPEALLMADTVVRLSSRPMRILEIHTIGTPREERSLGSPEFLALQAKFYT
jgi:NitT/TauT family transport system ATP-binding protein